MEIARRDLLKSAAVLTGALLVATSQSRAEAPPLDYVVKPLPFAPDKLRGISEKLIVSHHDKNYAGAVKRLGVIQQKIKALPADAQPFQLGSLKREELIAMNSMILHEYYFGNLGGDGISGGDILKTIESQFGSKDAWEHEFRLVGQSLAGGSGWVILSYSPRDKKLYNVWSADHTISMAGGTPLLVMDMYEHAYQMDYGAEAKSYIDAFFANLDWQKVDHRFKELKS